jgi:integrase
MSSLFQPRVTRYVILDENGQHQHRTPDGERVTKATPNAVKITTTSKVWRGQYRDAAGDLRQVSLCANKAASRQMLAELEVTARQAERGMVASYEQHHKRAIVEHLEDYRRSLRGSTPDYISTTVNRVRCIIDGCGFQRIADISASRVQTFLADLRDKGARIPPLPPPADAEAGYTKTELADALGAKPATLAAIVKRHGLAGTGSGNARRFPRETAEAARGWLRRGRGSQTIAHYLTAMKQFCRWLVKDRRTPSNAVEHLSVGVATEDIRHDRRALTLDEMRRLIAAAQSSAKLFRDISGPARAALYALACASGFRKSEIASLTPESFQLAAEPPCVVLAASAAKNGRQAVQPLPSDVAGLLATFLADCPPNRPVWPGTWVGRGAEMLRIDLEAAGIAYAVEGPNGVLFADLHSLRHSFVAALDRAGATLKTAMQLARHSDPALTAARYGRAQLHDLAGTVERLPSLIDATPENEPEAARATGTDDSRVARVAVVLQCAQPTQADASGSQRKPAE